MATLKIKQGETLVINGQYTEDDGITPRSLAGVTLKSQVRNKSGGLVATLTVTVTDVLAGTYTLTVPGIEGTLAWPAGNLYCDIKESVTNGSSLLTDTFTINVQRSETLI